MAGPLAGRVAIVVMAKAPEPGRVKTRLCPPLAEPEAAALARCFLLDTLSRVRAVDGAGRVLAHEPPGSRGLFASLAPDFTLVPQATGDLGARMSGAAAAALGLGASGIVLVGADAPHLPTDRLRLAVARVEARGADVVLGPSEDGGYYLIGSARLHRELFDGPRWSTASVLEDTLDRCRRAGLTVERLPLGYDVDTAESLARLEADLASAGPDDAPETRRFLAERRAARAAGRPLSAKGAP